MQTPWTPLFKGVDHAVGTNFPNTVFTNGSFIYTNPRLQVAHCLRIDLLDPDIRLFPSPPAPNPAPPERETLTTAIDSFIRNYGVQVAVNSSFYNSSTGGSDPPAQGLPCEVFGLVVCTGAVVSVVDGTGRYASLLFGTNNHPIVAFDNRPPGLSTEGIYTAITGFYSVLSNGVDMSVSAAIGYPDAYIHGPQPRMINGVSQDRRYLYLMSIDGRQGGYSNGATDADSAGWMLRFGAWDAINMDGGGSASMYMADTNGKPVALSRSSYLASTGRERYIGSHLGVYALPLFTFIHGVNILAGVTNASITWQTVSNGTTQVDYGLSPDYGIFSPLNPTPSTNHSVTLDNLLPSTTYLVRVLSNVGSNAFASRYTFRTKDFLTNLGAEPGLNSAVIRWTTAWEANGQVEYGLTSTYGNSTPIDPTTGTNQAVTLSGLTPGTRYFFRALSHDGTSRYSADGTFSTSNFPPQLVFDVTNSWRYSHDSLDGISWQAPSYDDSLWAAGPGFLWADSRGPNLTLPSAATQMPIDLTTTWPFITYYLRTHFNFPASPVGATLILSNYIDDGAVFYLNGVEIYRAFMDPAPAVITRSTLSTGFNCQDSGNATCPLVFTVAGDLITHLHAGDNVLSVEVHNYRATSPDVTFGGALLYTAIPSPTNRPPVVTDHGLVTVRNQPVQVPLSRLLEGDTDPDGDFLTLSVDPAVPMEGTVQISNGVLHYVPPVDFIGLDRFTTLVDDGHGGITPSTVQVRVLNCCLPAPNELTISGVPPGFVLRFGGKAGALYMVQSSFDLVNWTPVASVAAELDGLLDYTLGTAPAGEIFFRIQTP